MNYRPSSCIVNTVSNQLFRQVRILYLSKTTENKLRFQENVPVNSFRFDINSKPCISQGLPKSISRFNRTCQSREKDAIGQENQLFPKEKWFWRGKTNLFLGKRWFWEGRTNFVLWKTKTISFGKLCGQNPQRCFFFFLVFPFEKMVFLFSCPKPFLYRLILYKRLGNNQDILRIILGVNRKLVSQV